MLVQELQNAFDGIELEQHEFIPRRGWVIHVNLESLGFKYIEYGFIIETIFYILEPQRFQIDMDNPTAPWDKLVLFKFDAIESVLKLLDKHLPLRNFPLESKKIMQSNKDRNPKNEQLNKCSEHDLALEMKKLWSYYEFCEKNLPEGRDIAVVEVQTT